MKNLCFAVLLLLLFLTQQVDAQRTTIAARLSEHSNMGYEPHALGLTLSREQKLSKRFTLDLAASVDRARKIPGKGYHYGIGVSLRVYLTDRAFIYGGGSHSRQITNYYEKSGAGFNVGAGFDNRKWLLRAGVLLPDSSINHTRALDLSAGYYMPTERRVGLYLGGRYSLTRFDYQGRVETGVAVSGQVGIYFK